MSADLPNNGCCPTPPCPPSTQVPGPPGKDGTNGTNGTNGSNAYTITTSSFVMPLAGGDSIIIPVEDSRWVAQWQPIFISLAGFFQVASAPTPTSLEIINLGYEQNSPEGTVIESGVAIAATGFGGPAGDPGPPSNLNDISPTTTKGDLIVDNGGNSPDANNVRLAVGSSNQVLHADNTQPTGLSWKAIDVSGTNTSITGVLPIANGGTGQNTQQAALKALMPQSAVKGDLAKFDGTNWIRFAIGAALQLLRVNAAGNDLEFANVSNGLLQTQAASTSAATIITSTIPYGSSAPTNSQGTQFLSVSITPTSASSKLFIECLVNFGCASLDNVVLALFNGGTNAIATSSTISILNSPQQMSLVHQYNPGVTSAITFTLRIGTDGGSSITLNGLSGAQKFANTQKCWIRVSECV